jgi:hypothetical protein
MKFWAWIYRKTGWYSPFARLEEYRLLSEMLTHEQRIKIGSWQAKVGFVRSYSKKDLEKRLDRLRKKK